MSDYYSEGIKSGNNIVIRYHGSWPSIGLLSVELYHCEWSVPIGIVYYRWTYDDNIEILYSIVLDKFRRLGVRTRLNDALFNDFPKVNKIVTGGSETISAKWMKKYGYKQDKNGNWYVTRAMRKKAKKKWN